MTARTMTLESGATTRRSTPLLGFGTAVRKEATEPCSEFEPCEDDLVGDDGNEAAERHGKGVMVE